MNGHEGDVCPLCESFDKTEIKNIPYTEIWSGLEKEWKTSFSKEVIERHSPCEFTTLVECRNCGLEYFVPIVAGDSQFYHELSQSPRYYNQSQWEFAFVKRKLLFTDRVLDIGCGEGSFLSSIHEQVQQAIGIDMNPLAITRAAAAGLDAKRTDIINFAQTHGGMFDMVCCFQVIEHLPRIKPFIKAAVSCLKPNGLLILSVPNRQRIFQNPLDALDCPPHHVSRWDSKPLKKLGEIMGLRLTEIVFEMANRVASREWFRENCLRKYEIAYWMKRAVARIFFSSPFFEIYKRTGWLEKWGFYRLTILASYRKNQPRNSLIEQESSICR